MANPSNFQITPCVENNEINFPSLYLNHTSLGPKPAPLGTTSVINWKVYDGRDKVVARAQGLQIYAGNSWHNTFSLVFEVERFKGSTLQMMGISGEESEEGEWAIVGGTGEFTRATGRVISKKLHEKKKDGNTIKLDIHGSCPLPKGPRSLVTKIGPWGGNEGTDQGLTEAPRRLQSITVCHRKHEVVNSIVFSYIDHTGQERTSKRLGGSDEKTYTGSESRTIELTSFEFVKEVSGTFDKYKGVHNHGKVITSLTFVTNKKKYGPYGRTEEEGTPFTVPVKDNGSVVGFFGSGRLSYLHAVGIYVHPF